METKPLHVQVAAVLGWTGFEESKPNYWTGFEAGSTERKEVPSYGMTPCATGPLIPKYKISLIADYSNGWLAQAGHSAFYNGKTPWEAVGKLLLELDKQGKLNK